MSWLMGGFYFGRDMADGSELEYEAVIRYTPSYPQTRTDPGEPEEVEVEEVWHLVDGERQTQQLEMELTADELESIEVEASDRARDGL